MARSVHITKIKIIQHAISEMLSICYFDQFDNASPHQSKMIVSTQEKLCCLPVCKKTNSFVTCFLRYHKDMSILPWYLLHVQPNLSKKIVSIRKILQKLHFFLEILQRHHILVIFEYFTHTWQHPSNMVVSTCRKHYLLKKKNKFIPPFLRYSKDFANLFWVLSVWLAMPTKMDSINLQKSLMVICMQKIQLDPSLEILQRYCKIAIFGTLGMTGYGHQKRWYQLVENFDVNLHTQNQIYSSPLS